MDLETYDWYDDEILKAEVIDGSFMLRTSPDGYHRYHIWFNTKDVKEMAIHLGLIKDEEEEE